MFQIDNFAYHSKLLWNAPGAKIAFGAIPLVICLCFESIPVSLLTIFIMGAAAIYFSGINFGQYIKLLFIPLGFLVIGTLTIIFIKSKPSDILIGFSISSGTYGITRQSLQRGLVLIFKALGAVSCMYFISLNTAMNDIINFLHRIKIPNLIISLMELIYRYIFVILEEADKMKIAGASRLGYTGFGNSLKTTGELAGGLFIRTYMRCDRVYEALQSRGYEGEFKHMEQEYSSSKMLYIGCMVISLFLIIVGILEKGIFFS